MTPFRYMRMTLIVLCSICAIMLFGACEGVSGGTTTISGRILSVDSTAHSVVVQGSVNGQQQTLTISGLTDQQIAAIKGQTGNYSFQVVPNGTSYTISSNSQPVSQSEATPENATPQATSATTGTTTFSNVSGDISFIGTVQSKNGTNLVVLMPNGKPLSMTMGNTNDSNESTQQIAAGQQVKVKAVTNTDGSLLVKDIKVQSNEQDNDQNKTSLSGVATSAVGADNILHIRVGNQEFSALITGSTQRKHFNAGQTIQNNQRVKVDMLFTNGAENALQVEIDGD